MNPPNPIRILAAVHDPGGGRALAPVLADLQERTFAMTVLAGEYAQAILREDNLAFQPAKTRISPEEADRILKACRPDLLVTGTSWDSNLEQRLRNSAWRRNIPSIVILDFWSNYAPRWQGADYPLAELPDLVCVPDENAKREMMTSGFDPARIRVTGHPHLERLFTLGPRTPEEEGPGREGNVLFVSQPLGRMGITVGHPHPVAILLKALRANGGTERRPCTLNVRLHPKERVTPEILQLMESNDPSTCKVRLADSQVSIYQQIRQARIVVGYDSMGLFEARAMGKRVLSLDVTNSLPGLKGAMVSAGIEVVSCSERCILEKLAGQQKNPRMDFGNGHLGSKDRVLSLFKALGERPPQM